MWFVIIEHWDGVLKENLGETNKSFNPYIIALFFFLLGLNLMGFFLFTLPPTTHIVITLGIALSV